LPGRRRRGRRLGLRLGCGLYGSVTLAAAHHEALVDPAHQVTQGVHGVVMLLLRRLGVRRIRVVAVETGLGEEVGTAPFDDQEGAIFQPRPHRPYAGPSLVVAPADHEVGATQLLHLAGPRWIAIPGDVA